MPIEDDPTKINDPDRHLEAKVVAQGKKYQGSRIRSSAENKIKAEGRKEIADLGFRTDAYQNALRVSRDLTPAEQKDYVKDFRYFLKVFLDNQSDLWPEDAARAEARAKRRAERKAKAAAAAGKETPEQQERRLAADSNPRSNPDRGGAGKRPRKPKTIKEAAKASDEALAASIADVHAQEQATGDSILSAHIAEMDKRANEHTVPETEGVDATELTGKPMSQSEIAAQKMREAGLA